MNKIRKIILAVVLIASFWGWNPMSAKAQQDMGEASIREMNQVMTVMTECEVREFPDDNAASVMSYEAGASAWVIGETQNGWYKVSYQGKEGFVPKECITDLQVEIDGNTVTIAATEKNNTIPEEAEDNKTEESADDTESDETQDETDSEEEPLKQDIGEMPEEESKKTVSLAEAGLDTEMAAMEAENKIFVEEIERQNTEAKRTRIWKIIIVLLVIAIFATGTVSTIHENKKRKDSDKDQ